jgi:hypothetical protein
MVGWIVQHNTTVLGYLDQDQEVMDLTVLQKLVVTGLLMEQHIHHKNLI